MTMKYILEGKSPKPVDDILEWGKWFETADRRVARTKMWLDVEVSTVFLGLDHSFDRGAPILFETMIFGGKHHQYQERYYTWEEAEVGHRQTCILCEGNFFEFLYTLLQVAFGPRTRKGGKVNMEDQKWKARRRRTDRVHEILDGKISNRACMLIAREYLYGYQEKPLEELTDAELLGTKFIGPKTVAELRTVVPSPQQ
ncbi:hypothetical protein ES703_00120 [subsurface metagenome]